MNRAKPRMQFFRAVLAGLGASACIYPQHTHAMPNRSDGEAMRGDWERIGQDFQRVIARERVKAVP